MKKRTHLRMAKLVLHTIEQKYPELIPSKGLQYAFLFGAVEPDLSLTQFTTPHFWTKSKDWVYEKIEKLFSKDELFKWDMYQMGRICHYLSDFCCYVHINGGIGNPKVHLMYEDKIQKFLFANTEEYKRSLIHIEPTDDFITLCDAVIKEYRKGEPNVAKDLELAMTMSAMLVYNLLAGENMVDPAKDLEELLKYFISEFNLAPVGV